MSSFKNKLKIIICLFLLIPFALIQAQTIEQIERLQEIESLSQNLNDSDVSSFVEDNREEGEIEVEEPQVEEVSEVQFGFTGRENFLVSPVSKDIQSPLQYFGYDYFSNNTNTFFSSSDMPIPSDYILGPGDEIKFILFGSTNKKYSLIVTREGDIFIPEIGPISVAGLTFSNLKETIENLIENQLIGTKVSLTLGELRSINIFVLGEAVQPGMYRVSALSTLTNAIFLSGGINTTGSLRTIQLKRNGEVVSNFDFYELLLNGDTSKDSKLMPGDVIFIPAITKKVAINGEVQRPGIYELHEEEVAEDIIKFAGGLKSTADLSSVELQRIDVKYDGFKLLDVNLEENPFSELQIQDGDTLSIFPIINKLNQAILLTGHTQKPGYYPWKEGMRILDLIESKEDLLPMTDMKFLLIKRESKTAQNYQTLQISLEKLFSKSDKESNIILNERDELIFFPSLLTTDLIQVSLLDSDYDDIDDQLMSIYVENSLSQGGQLIDTRVVTQQQEGFDSITQESQATRLFSYNVYDYCLFNSQQASVFLDDRFQNLEDTSIRNIEQTLSEAEKNKQLTKLCRGQLIQPVIELLVDQATPTESQQIVDIFGNVSYPGKYPLSINATLEDILAASGGLNDLTVLEEIEITSRTMSSKTLNERSITLDYTNGLETMLRPLDIITIKSISNENKSVIVDGEVFFPGIYPIAKTDTFKDLLTRAGGITKEANVKQIFFSRQSLIDLELSRLETAKEELKRQILLTRQNNPGESENSEYLNRLLLLAESQNPNQQNLGRLIADFEKILTGSLDDIVLQDGDRILVPSSQQVITVVGEVYAPNSHLYNSDMDITEYIVMSGGVTDFADQNSIYIIKANGSIEPLGRNRSSFFRNSAEVLSPGDTIVIPIEIRNFSGLKATTEITQILYQMALAAAAVNSF